VTGSATPQLARSAPPSFLTLLAGVMPIAIGVGLALLLQFVVRDAVGPFYAKVLMDIGINVILAVSLTMVNGFTGQFSIGHAGFMAVGGYTAGCITYYGSMLLWGDAMPRGGFLGAGEWLFVGACVVGGFAAAGAGYIVGLPSLRLRGDYLAIVTLGFGEIVRVLLQQTGDVLFTAEEVRATPLPRLVTKVGGSLGFGGLPFYSNLFWIYVFVAATLVVAYRLKTSTHGRAFLSIREDEIASEAMGVNTTRYKVRAFVLSAFFAGIAGALFAHLVGVTLNPRELGFQRSFDIVIMVVLGGMGSISGAALAAIALTILPEALRGDFGQYRMIVYALVLILMMIIRPQGLFGIHELWELGPLRRLFARKGGK
jgi:branched-chain amino acid transport system permease protein